ncbi:MAG TPA: hypothetical protein ENN90_11720 [Mariniphaga anaerophila]|uniref:Uncharacterized protein n=1 Tax=Mariniphaga anaerophila TaxID=1484053 RepID=A0A831LCU3_9BACT|nr:hypothetical protein [Mariniphaga anaerophila]
METKEVKYLLQRYFNGESTLAEERQLEKYFQTGKVADELKEYAGFFGGISELSQNERDAQLEEEIMDFILETESKEKTKYRRLWQTVTGIAATVIIVIGGLLFYQQGDQQFDDTFDNPEEAYAYAEQTLGYISAKYNKGMTGMASLSNFGKLSEAAEPMQKGVRPVNEYLKMVEKMRKD